MHQIKCFLLILFGIINTCYAKYYSQCGQDQYVNETFFKNKRNGVFVDIGAHRGIEISNTYFFESELGWTGLCIEPIPELFEDLIQNRNCTCIQGCISDKIGKAQFIRFTNDHAWFSGLQEKYDKSQLQNLQTNYGFTYELIEVKCYTFNDLMQEHGIYHIDLLSIDTEGGELDILKSIDFKKINIDIIVVEDNLNNPEFISFLNLKGYDFVKRLYQDILFVKRNLAK